MTPFTPFSDQVFADCYAPPAGAEKYTEEEAKAILREAAAFDETDEFASQPQHGFTHEHLETIAAEAGISGFAVRAAADRHA